MLDISFALKQRGVYRMSGLEQGDLSWRVHGEVRWRRAGVVFITSSSQAVVGQFYRLYSTAWVASHTAYLNTFAS